jgi:acyl-CoA dehydrogenase
VPAVESADYDGIWVAETKHDPFLSCTLAIAATGEPPQVAVEIRRRHRDWARCMNVPALKLIGRNYGVPFAAHYRPVHIISPRGSCESEDRHERKSIVMAWDFETPPEMQGRLDWADEFVREEVEPLDYLINEARDMADPIRARLIPPLQQIVKERGMWASHLHAKDGGSGISAVEASLLNEILGRTKFGPNVFGCQSPDAGNAEILAAFASPAQRARYLEPLAAGEVMSAFAATEPQGGGDPTIYQTAAVEDGDDWVINGEKWFISGAEFAHFFIVMAMTDPDRPRHERMSLFMVPQGTPGLEVVRSPRCYGKENGDHHSYVRFNNLRVPANEMLGTRGDAFKIMQARMGVARLLLATRSLGQLKQTFEMMCERAVSRFTQGERLADKQLVQQMIAQTWMDISQFRLSVLHTAWRLDRVGNSRELRPDISAVKAMTARVMKDTALRAVQLHGSLGTTAEVPFMDMLSDGVIIGIADGPSEIHEVTLGRELLRGYPASDSLFPTRHVLLLRERALAKYSDALADLLPAANAASPG